MFTAMSERKITILGAGVTGLSCALALLKRTRCQSIEILERETLDSLPLKPGHGLLLMQNGVKALQALGIDGLLSNSTVIKRAVFRDNKGIPIRVDELDSVYCVTRSEIIAALKSALPRNCLRLNQHVERVIVGSGTSVHERQIDKLVFENGEVDELENTDFIIDAAGIGSPLFKALYPGVQRPKSRVKEIVTSSHMPDLAQQLKGAFIKTQFSEAGLAFGLLAPTSTQVIGFLQFDSDRYSPPKNEPAEIEKFLKHLLINAPEPIPTYLDSADYNSAHVWHPTNTDMPKHIHCKNGLMLGDAAHPLLPFTSQGISAALEDAIMFADLIEDSNTDLPFTSKLKGFSIDRERDMREYIDGGRKILQSFIDPSYGFSLPYVDGAASNLESHLSLPKGSLRQLIQVLDIDSDGFLNRQEFDLALLLLDIELSPEQSSRLFTYLDANFDGKLSYDEFIQAIAGNDETEFSTLHFLREQLSSSRNLSLLTIRGRLANVFRQLDRNGNGVLDFEEFRVATASLGILYTANQTRKAFNELDKNSDGTINFEEMLGSIALHKNAYAKDISERLQRLSGLTGDFSDQLFSDDKVNLAVLRNRAFNFRWATLAEDTIPLTAADSDFPISQEISNAVQAYIGQGYLPYGPAGGLPHFRDTVAQHYLTKHNVSCRADQVLATDSAASALYLVANFALSLGDEAIIADPVDFLFERSVVAAGGVVRRFKLDRSQNFAFDPAQIESLINNKTRLLSICNPHNPSGRVWKRTELETLCEIALKHRLWIMSDEVWADIVYSDNDFCSVASISPEIASRTFTIYGFSKGYGLAGLRAGVLICPDVDTSQVVLAQSHADETAYGVSTLSQIAGIAAIELAQDWLSSFVDHLQQQRDFAIERLNGFESLSCHSPEGTFVLFPKITGFDHDATAIVDVLAKHHGIAVVPGSPQFFGPGAAGHIRLSIATSRAILTEGLERLEGGLKKLNV